MCMHAGGAGRETHPLTRWDDRCVATFTLWHVNANAHAHADAHATLCQANAALRLLDDASGAERRVLGSVEYFDDLSVTHTDGTLMHVHMQLCMHVHMHAHAHAHA